jgi:hypothetical protein
MRRPVESRKKFTPPTKAQNAEHEKVGRDQGLKLAMLWWSHIAVRLIFRNVAN